MASLSIYLGEDQLLPDGFGIGFFGDDGFGAPVLIGEFQGRTFVTDASGIVENFEVNNNKRLTASTVINGQIGSGIPLTSLTNTLSTINMRFEDLEEVRTISPRLYIFDGSFDDDNNPNFTTSPDGLTMYCAEIRHTDEIQTDNGLGDTVWQETAGAVYLALIDSPGTLGLRPGGAFTTDTRHDWYIAMSVTPTSLGNKMFGLYFEVEFL